MTVEDSWEQVWKDVNLESIPDSLHIERMWVYNILIRIKKHGDELKDKAERYEKYEKERRHFVSLLNKIVTKILPDFGVQSYEQSVIDSINYVEELKNKLETIKNGGGNIIGGLKVLIEGHPEIENEIECFDGVSKWTEISFNQVVFESWTNDLMTLAKQLEELLEDED
jgi:hypothetical protein